FRLLPRALTHASGHAFLLSVSLAGPPHPLFAFTTPGPPEHSPLSLHDALPIWAPPRRRPSRRCSRAIQTERCARSEWSTPKDDRSEEHTSELQSRGHLVCRLRLEKKNRGGGDSCCGPCAGGRRAQVRRDGSAGR